MTLQLLLDETRGIYIPHAFVTTFDLVVWHVEHLKDAIADCSAVDNENYWEAWQEILETAWYDLNGEKYMLMQDGSLWAGTEEDFELLE